MLDQEVLLAKIRLMMEREGRAYRKTTRVFARPAREGETVNTVTADGLETVNVAKPGDWLVRNQTEAGEAYLLPEQKFAQRYQYLRPAEGEWAEYQSIGHIRALELTPERLQTLQLPAEFEFIAAWGSPMLARRGDFLACPEDFREVYRIARAEFEQTYEPC
ncbi:MAG: hypothetical protein RMJ33_07260 [Saprospiraceae bacterium]|nr:hypothetical protein [Saprospiraceae bacterium]